MYPPTILGRAGFVVAAVGGVLTAATAGSTAVEQGDFGYIEVAGGSWIGVVAAVLCVAAAAAPWVWARVTGVGIASFFAILVAFALIGFRTSEELLPGEDVTLASAGWLMLVSSLLLFAGTAIALAGFRRPARGPDPAAAPREGKAAASLVLGDRRGAAALPGRPGRSPWACWPGTTCARPAAASGDGAWPSPASWWAAWAWRSGRSA